MTLARRSPPLVPERRCCGGTVIARLGGRLEPRRGRARLTIDAVDAQHAALVGPELRLGRSTHLRSGRKGGVRKLASVVRVREQREGAGT